MLHLRNRSIPPVAPPHGEPPVGKLPHAADGRMVDAKARHGWICLAERAQVLSITRHGLLQRRNEGALADLPIITDL